MKLLIDIGNTSLKWAVYEAGKIGPMRSAAHFGALPIDVMANWETLTGIEQVLIASVGPETVKDAVTAAVGVYWQCAIQTIETQAQAHGVTIAYADPARLGVDRFLAMIGARTLVQRATPASPTAPILVIDAGTAITFDALSAQGTHLGGQILPGIATIRQSLLANTRLPPHQTQDHANLWAQDTGPAIAAASLQAPAALAERLAHHLRDEAGHAPIIVLTGGDAERLSPLVNLPVEFCGNLVLLGLEQFA